MKQLIILYFIFSSIAINAQDKSRYDSRKAEQTFDEKQSGLNNSLINQQKLDSAEQISRETDKKVAKQLADKKVLVDFVEEQRIARENKKKEVKKRIDILKKIEKQKVLKEKEINRNIIIAFGIVILLVILFYLTRTITKFFKTKQMGNTIKNTLRTYNFKNLRIRLILKDKFKNLSKEEIIVASIVIGTLMAILLGYVFGETQYLDADGKRIFADITTIKEDYNYMSVYESYAFNYFIGTTSFIVFSRISFLYLSKNKTNTEHREIVNDKADDVNEPKVEIKGENKDVSKHIPSFEEGTMEDFLNL